MEMAMFLFDAEQLLQILYQNIVFPLYLTEKCAN
jgi:hypothetical protein